jgi:rubrerythrin
VAAIATAIVPVSAGIVSECTHGLTYAFCPACKDKSRGRVKVETAWGRASSLPSFPHTEAEFDKPCPWCDYGVHQGEDLVFFVENEWVCEECARDWERDEAT